MCWEKTSGGRRTSQGPGGLLLPYPQSEEGGFDLLKHMGVLSESLLLSKKEED